MISAADVRYSNRSVSRSAFQKCMGRVPSDGKIPDDMSAEGKCTVLTELTRSVCLGRSVNLGDFDRPTYRPRLTSEIPAPTYVPTEA